MRNKEMVLAYPLFDSIVDKYVLMGSRRLYPWLGKFSGFGGNVEEGDRSPEERQVVELWEEAKIIAKAESLLKVAKFDVQVAGHKPKILHVYLLEKFSGGGEKTEEMHPKWFDIRKLPDNMIDGDSLWVSRILKGETLIGTIVRDANFNIVMATFNQCTCRELY
jgi:hypothetical protein